MIFDHASFLQCQRHAIFPEGFIDEILRTLKLVFPKGHKATAKWDGELATTHGLDPSVPECGYLRANDRHIEHFKYWHDRLIDEMAVQWYTFWVAVLVLVLTVFFGLVQSIQGALQVYKAYHPTAP